MSFSCEDIPQQGDDVKHNKMVYSLQQQHLDVFFCFFFCRLYVESVLNSGAKFENSQNLVEKVDWGRNSLIIKTRTLFGDDIDVSL